VTNTEPDGLRRIARNAVSLLAGNAAGEALTGYALYLAATRLGPASFGQLSAAQAFMEPFDILANFGLIHIIMRFAAERKGADGTVRGTLLGVRLGLAVLAATIAPIVAHLFHRDELLPIIGLLCVNTLLSPFAHAALLPYDYEQTSHRRIYVPAVVSLVRVGTAIWASRALPTPVGFQLSGLTAGIFSIGLSIFIARRHYPATLEFDRDMAKRVLQLAWAAAVTDVIATIYLRGAYWVLHDQPVEIGLYAAADRLVKPILTISATFVMSGLPTIARLVQAGDRRTLSIALTRVTTRTVLYSVPIVGASWLLAPLLLKWLVPAYAAAVWPFRLLSLSVVFVVITQLAYVFIMAMGRTRAIMVIACVNFVVYFGLAHALAPTYGARGAALATTVMEGINMALQVVAAFFFLRRLPQAEPTPDPEREQEPSA
jgi:O-antigen/teichoic acid export membrane protein